MPMSSYQVVSRAIEFDGPDRLPVRFDALGINDVHGVSTNQIGTGDHAKRESYDEWGCRWVRSEISNMGQVKGHPLESWVTLNRYQWPDPEDPAFYEGMESRFEGSDGKYIQTGIFMLLFERMHSLHGMENLLLDLALEREHVKILADKIVEYDLAVIRNISERFPGRIHGFSFTDDWGTERATFVSPSLWQRFFKPRYARIFEAAHEAGWHVWMHTCGKVNEIIEELIDIGLDVINLQQPRLLGIEEIGRRFRGRICFESLCDIQRTLPFKGQEEIHNEARLLLENWTTDKGGFILSDYGDGQAIGAGNEAVGVEKKKLMLEAFQKLDPWKS